MKSPIKCFNMIILMEHDLEKAVAFYESLGMSLVFHLPNRWAEFDVSGVKLGLCPISKSQGEVHSGIVLEVENIKEMYEKFKDKIEFVSEPLEKVHGLMLSFKDPGGNIIDLYQPTHEKVAAIVKQAKEDSYA